MKILALAPVAAFAALGLMLIMGAMQPRKISATGYLDRPLPLFKQPALAGMKEGLSSQNLKGRIALINVFSSWCGACRKEHPWLMKLAGKSSIPMYGINWKDRAGAGKLFLTRFGNPYRGVGGDADGGFGAKLGVTGVPETYLIDAVGNIRYRHIGPLNDDIWNNVISPLISKLKVQK